MHSSSQYCPVLPTLTVDDQLLLLSTALASARMRSPTLLRTLLLRLAMVYYVFKSIILVELTFPPYIEGCAPLIKKGFAELQQLATYPQGWASITQAFRLCTPIKSQNDAFAVINWVDSGLIGMAMLDYPFPTNYGISLPGRLRFRL